MLPAATARKRRGNPVAIDGNLGGVTGTPLNNYLSRLAEWSGGAIWEREPWKGLVEGNSIGVNMTAASINKAIAFAARPEFSTGRKIGDISMIWPGHLDRAVPQNNAAAVTISNTIGAGDDAKVWSALKDGNGRWMVGQWVNAVGDLFRIMQTLNEPDGNPHRYCAYHPTNTGTVGGFSGGGLLDTNTCLSRVVAMQRMMWEEVRGPCRYNRWPRPHIAIATPPLAETSKKVTRAAYVPYTIYDLLTFNSGEILRYADLVGIHSYDECMNFALANPGNAVLSMWHVWTAIINGQNAAGLGRAHGLYTNEQGIDERLLPPPLRTASNHGADFLDNTRTEAWDAANAPTHHSKLTARRRLKVRRTGAMAAHNVFWAICLTGYYNFNDSPDDGMNLCPGYEGFTPREPSWTATKTLLDFERYRLTGYGPWPLTIAAKPWASFTNNLTIATVGFHDPLTWLIVADFDKPEKADPASTTVRTWHEWDRATITNNQIAFTAPVAGQGIQLNTAIRIVWVPFGGWYRATVNFSGNTGTVRLYAHGHDKVNGMAMPSVNSTAASGTLTILFGTRGHRARGAPNLPIFCVCLEATAAANFSSPTLKAESIVQESAVPPPVEPPPEPEPGTCTATRDLFRNPQSKAYPLHIPQGSSRTLIASTSREVALWKKQSSAGLNLPKNGFGCPIYDCRSTTGTQQVTVNGFTFRIPSGFGPSFNGPDGTDQTALFYQADHTWIDVWRFRWNGSAWEVGVDSNPHRIPDNSGALSPRSSSASSLWHQLTTVRLHEWQGSGRCEHALGIMLQGGTASNYQLGQVAVWPATSVDSSAGSQPADGIKYGSWWVMPRPSEGGPAPETLGLGAAGSLAWRLYEQARDYGWVVNDKSGGAAFRADQTCPDSMPNEWRAATAKLWQYMRQVTNVGATGSNPIGGGTALAPNCAFDRPAPPTPPAIQPLTFWENRWGDGSDDLDQFLDNSQGITSGVSQPKDSWPMYQLGLGIDGNCAFYRATKNTKYLDRCLLYIENCINRAVVSNNTNFPSSQYKDGFLGWIDLTHPKNTHGLEQALYEFYMWRYVMMLCYHARNQPGYAARIANIIAFTETNIWTKWYGRNSGQSQLYRTVVHICAHTAIVALYGRELFVSPTVRAQCQTVLDNIDHDGMTLYTLSGVKANFRGQLLPHPNNSGAYIWKNFWPSLQAANPEPNYADTDHADAFIPYAIAAYEQGYGGWDLDDLTRLRATTTITWPSRGVYYNFLIGQSGGLRASGGNFNDGGVKHGGFNAAFQQRVEDHLTAPNSAAGTQFFGNGALNAARLLGTL